MYIALQFAFLLRMSGCCRQSESGSRSSRLTFCDTFRICISLTLLLPDSHCGLESQGHCGFCKDWFGGSATYDHQRLYRAQISLKCLSETFCRFLSGEHSVDVRVVCWRSRTLACEEGCIQISHRQLADLRSRARRGQRRDCRVLRSQLRSHHTLVTLVLATMDYLA